MTDLSTLAASLSEAQKLASRLQSYAVHPVGCGVYGSWATGEPRCTCGLDEANAALRDHLERNG